MRRLALHLLEEAGLKHDVEHGIADRRGQGIAAEGAAVAAGGHAGRRRLSAEEGADRKAAAQTLGERHGVGLDPGPLIGEELAAAAHAALHLVEQQEQPELVADRAQATQELDIGGADAALALNRLDHDRRRLGADRGAQLVHVAEGDLVEAARGRPEAFQVLGIPGRREGGQGPPVEGARAGDDARALRPPGVVMILARHLDHALDRLGARVAEEDPVREAVRAEALGQAPRLGDLVEIGDVPELLRLRGQGRDHVRMGMAQGVDRDAGREIEESSAVRRVEEGPLAPLEGERRTRVGRHDGIGHEKSPMGPGFTRGGPAHEKKGVTIVATARPVNQGEGRGYWRGMG